MDTQAKKFNAGTVEDDDELEEESLLETPLDKIEPYGQFKGSFLSTTPPSIFLHAGFAAVYVLIRNCTDLQQEQPQLYENLMKILSPPEQEILQQVIAQADKNAAAAQQAAAQQQMNGAQHT